MRILAICLVLVVCLCSFASAAPDASESSEPTGYVYVDPDVLKNSPDWQLTSVSTLQAPVAPVGSSAGLKGILLNLIGDYNPPVVEYQYQNYNQSQYSYLREVVPDFPWIGACLLFLLLVYGLIRLGGVLCRR